MKKLSIICFLSILIFLCGSVSALAEGKDAVTEAGEVIDGIISFNSEDLGATDIQRFIDDVLTERIGGTAEWYVLALSQYGDYDLSKYRNALEKYLQENDVKGASARLKFALLLSYTDGDRTYIDKCLNDDTVGGQGIMSYVFGLHLYNNGFSGKTSKKEVIEKLKELRHEDGGWSVTGSYGDVDVTAMTLSALAPLVSQSDILLLSGSNTSSAESSLSVDYPTPKEKLESVDLSISADTTLMDALVYESVRTDLVDMVSGAISFLSERQLENGDFSSFGVRNAESTAQVIVALSALGIDCTEDERFIKNGKSPFDGLLLYRLSDGSFMHKEGDVSSPTATVQTFYSMVAYLRMKAGLTPLYVRDKEEKKPETVLGKLGKSTSGNVEKNDPEEKNGQETGDHSSITDKGSEGEKNSDIRNADIEKEDFSAGNNSAEDKNSSIGEKKTDEAGEATLKDTDDREKINSSGNGYKIYAIIGIIATVLVVCLILFLRKKHWKNYVFVGLLGAFGIVIILFTDFSSPEAYYGQSTDKTNVVGTVTMSIRCDILKGKKTNEHIPEDFCILDTTEFDLEEGETAYDILLEAAKRYSISIEHEGSSDIVYISGINYLYENDYGDLSGWVYKVNGELPSVGCAGYVLHPGDKIEWCYTLDLGNDVLMK